MPTRDTPWPAGTPCWVDYGAADVASAQAFYTDLLGWTWTGGDPEFGGYLNAHVDGRQVAGLGPAEGGPPSWTTYFATDDAATAVRRIRDAGGEVVVEPMAVGPLGTMVIARDPQGNRFGLWQAGQHTGVQRFGEPGSLVWNDAAVDDPEAARAFYTAVFGFTWDPMAEMPAYATFRTGPRPLGGLGPVQPGLPTGWSTCFGVASTDAAVTVVESSGGTVLHPAEDTQFGRFAVVQDRWGAAFAVMQVPAGE